MNLYQIGYFYPNLSAEKQKYFDEHGYATGPSHNLCMQENGEWRLTLGVPIVQHIAKTVSPQPSAMKWPNNDLLYSIIEKCDRIAELQKIKNSKKE